VKPLRDLQFAFADAVQGGGNVAVLPHIEANGLAPERRLQVYRNNLRIGLTSALQAVYPVIFRLVGEDYFDYAARRYIARHPSRSGNLNEYGRHFDDLLSTLPSARQHPYLPDVAGLEWAVHLAFYAADHAALDPRGLGDMDVARLERLCFKLHPSCRLLRSGYPIASIYTANQPDIDDAAQTVNLSVGGEYVLVQRREFDIEIVRLDAGDYALLHALSCRQPLARACEAAFAADEDFDLTACLRRHVMRTTLVECFVMHETMEPTT
jgi:hypothetical protein